jgi:U3 small nucleolar RNA-associated protein 20
MAFNIDTSSGVVKEDDRAGLLPVLCRILLGKMLQRKAQRGGKQAPHVRRGLILGFLMQGDTDGLRQFMQLLFEPFSHYPRAADSLQIDVDPTRVVPLKVQYGFLSVLLDLMGKLQRQIVPFLDEVISILLHIAAQARLLLQPEARASLASRHVGLLKALRLTCIKRMTALYQTFPDYDFGPHQPRVEAHMVAPQLDALCDESYARPSALLLLLSTWSEHWRLAPLLSGLGDTVLPAVFGLLRLPALAGAVKAVVLQMIDRLLGDPDRSRGSGGSREAEAEAEM